MEKKPKPTLPDGYKVIYVAYITVKGKRLYAKKHGKRAWPLRVKDK